MTRLARALLLRELPDEAEAFLERSLGIQERVYGAVHPRVASALNELAGIALQRDRPDDADGLYARMLEIYRSVHGERHHLVALALANRASVDLLRGEFARAERAFRGVVSRYSVLLSPEDLNTGIARIKLGRALLGLKRYGEAVEESLAGYGIVAKTADPGVSWLRAARRDLDVAYDGLGQTERAARFRAEQAAIDANAD